MQPDSSYIKKKRNSKWEVSDSYNILHHFNHITTQTGMTLDGRIRIWYTCAET